MIWILALYLDFEGANNIHVLYALVWGFEGCWNFLNGVWYLDFDFYMVTGLCYIIFLIFCCLNWSWRWKEHLCPPSPDLGLWRMLKCPEWGSASWPWFGYSHWSLIYPSFEFWLSILILKVQRTSKSFKSQFRALVGAGDSWLWFAILILIKI